MRLEDSKTRLLDAALEVIRAKGYAASTVDDICRRAELTKGSFFHHFKSKEELALAAASHFAWRAAEAFDAADYRKLEDPFQRLMGYVTLRKAMLGGRLPEYTCLLGTMVQETYETHPAIREACDLHLAAHSADVAKDVQAAKRLYAPGAPWSARSVALYMQAVIQGAFVLAKARNGPQIAAQCLDHLERYLEMLFNRSRAKE